MSKIKNRRPTPIFVGIILLCTIAASLLAYSYFIEPSRLVVRDSVIAIPGLDPAIEGMKIVLISDIHGGSNDVTFDRLREVVARANEQEADLIFLLGDYVSEGTSIQPPSEDGLKMSMTLIANGLAGLTAKLGVFAVLGNHDGGFGDSRVSSELERVGIRVLENEVAVVDVNGRPLRILGFRDHLKLAPRWKHISSDAQKLLEQAGDGDLIALQHSPDIIPEITGAKLISPKLRLVLAGHTHGGQIWLPIFGRAIIPSSYGQKYAYGHIRENGIDIFVTSGIGTSLLPLRFLVPPEIAVLTLRPL
ncbi:metallophosphoesterase [soil metagenome]